MFLNSFESQRNAEFPAYEIQGPFCAMSQRVQVGLIWVCLVGPGPNISRIQLVAFAGGKKTTPSKGGGGGEKTYPCVKLGQYTNPKKF